MSIESVTKDENLRGAYIVKLTQNMDNQTVYVVSVLLPLILLLLALDDNR